MKDIQQVIKNDALSETLEDLIIDPIHYGFINRDKGEKDESGVFPYARIIIVNEGLIQVNTFEEKVTLERFSCCIIPRNTITKLSFLEKTSYVYIDFIAKTNMAAKDIEKRIDLKHIQSYPKLLNQRQMDNLLHLNTTVVNEYPGTYLLVRAMIFRIFIVALLYREKNEFEPLISKNPTHTQKVLLDCINYIEKHNEEMVQVSDLAQDLNYTPNYIYKIFMEFIDISPKEFIMQYKLNQSLTMLKGSSDSIGEIATRLGFSSLYHFSTAFKKMYGTSPLKYRKNLLDN